MKRRLWIRFFIPYLIVLVLSVISGNAANQAALRVAEAERYSNVQTILTFIEELLDRQFAEVTAIRDQLESNSLIQKFQIVTDPYKGANTYQVIYTMGNLPNYSQTRDFVVGYNVLFKESNLALGPMMAYTINDFFDHGFAFEGMSKADWKELLLDEYQPGGLLPAGTAVYDGHTYSAIPYFRSIGYPGYTRATLLLLIDNRRIENLLSNLISVESGWAYIRNESGMVISYIGDPDIAAVDKLFADQSATVTTGSGTDRELINFRRSATTGWTIAIGQSYEAVMDQVSAIRKRSIVIIALSVAVGMFISLLMAQWNSKPIRDLLAIFSASNRQGTQNRDDSFQYIGERVRNLIDDQEALENEMSLQRPYIRTALAHQLMTGRIDAASFASLSRQAGIDPKGKVSLAGIFSLVEPTAGNTIEVLAVVRNAISTALADTSLYADIDQTSIGIVILFKATESQYIRSKLADLGRNVQSAIRRNYGVSTHFSFGSIMKDPLSLSLSFEQAHLVLARESLESEGIGWFDRMSTVTTGYYYPERIEFALMNALRAGNQTKVTDIMSDLYTRNLSASRLNPLNLKIFWFELAGTLKKIVDEIDLDNEEIDLDLESFTFHIDKLDAHCAGLADRCAAKICSLIDKRKHSHNNALVSRIIEYVDANLADANLSLSHVAEVFDHSEAYLSRFFKEQTGGNFVHHVEIKRMEKAKGMLANSGFSIHEIAALSGYRTSNTFCRAFKRRFSTSASEFRKSAVSLSDK